MIKLGKIIKDHRFESHLSLRDFSNKCHLSHTYINKLEDSKVKTGQEISPTIDALGKIASAMGISLEQLLREAGYIEPKNFESSNLELIRGKMDYEEVSKDIQLKTGIMVDPFVYEEFEKGAVQEPSPIFIDLLARYTGVDSTFFYKKKYSERLGVF